MYLSLATNRLRRWAIPFALLGALTAVGCKSSPGQSGFLAGYYDQLEPDPGDSDIMVWMAGPDVLAKYDKFLIDPIAVEFAAGG